MHMYGIIKNARLTYRCSSKSLKKLFSQLLRASGLIGEKGVPQKFIDDSFCSSIFKDTSFSSSLGSYSLRVSFCENSSIIFNFFGCFEFLSFTFFSGYLSLIKALSTPILSPKCAAKSNSCF